MKNYKSLVKQLVWKADKLRPALEKPCIINGKFYVTNTRVAATFNLTEDQMAEYETAEWSEYIKECCEGWLMKGWNFESQFQKFYRSEISKALGSVDNIDDMPYMVIKDNNDHVCVDKKFAKFLIEAMKSQKVDFVNVYVTRRGYKCKNNIMNIYVAVGDDIRLITLPMMKEHTEDDVEFYVAQPDTIAYDQIQKEAREEQEKLEERNRKENASVPYYEEIVEKFVDVNNVHEQFNYPMVTELDKGAIYAGNGEYIARFNLTDEEIGRLNTVPVDNIEKGLIDIFNIFKTNNWVDIDIKKAVKGTKKNDIVYFAFNGQLFGVKAAILKNIRFAANKQKCGVKFAFNKEGKPIAAQVGKIQVVFTYIKTNSNELREDSEELKVIDVAA